MDLTKDSRTNSFEALKEEEQKSEGSIPKVIKEILGIDESFWSFMDKNENNKRSFKEMTTQWDK